ncbi:3-hydroxy-3-methylglutaryl-CoA lyase [Candidatus Aerophobetes bacterium]|nr:3-hydroxy-3-methylglutaryl-CoA lyase [Candidatus Aerophobetes bacterium]
MQGSELEKGRWRTSRWWVSHYNFAPEVYDGMNLPEEIVIHDSTLRDGEQAPGVIFSKSQKLEIARMLDEIGVQYIEAGFPVVSTVDQEVISELSKGGLKAKITCLARAMRKDIQIAKDCGVWGAVMEVPVGYPRLKYQFEWEEDEVLRRTFDALEYAEEKDLNVILFLIDSARARESFLKNLVERCSQIKLVKKICIVDTLGVISPEGIKFLVKKVKSWTPLPIEVHCHNDFGLATANTIAALTAGASSFSCTVNGLGQRGGNAPLEEIVFALRMLYGITKPDLNLKKIRELSLYVQEVTGIKMPPYKAVVGEKLFTWEAGIPVAALRKLPFTVEPFLPEVIGETHKILLGKKCGKANILAKLEEYNLQADENLVEELVKEVKELAIRKNDIVSDVEFKEIYQSKIQKINKGGVE